MALQIIPKSITNIVKEIQELQKNPMVAGVIVYTTRPIKKQLIQQLLLTEDTEMATDNTLTTPANDRQQKINEFFEQQPEFKEWIEQTSLFNSIKINSKMAGYADIIIQATTESEEFTLHLNGTPIDKAEELPLEVIQNFVANYPGNRNYLTKFPNQSLKLIE